MTTITAKPGEVLDLGDYPPTAVFVDFFNGTATILRLDRPEEDIDDAIRLAASLRKANVAAQRRELDRRLKSGHDKDTT